MKCSKCGVTFDKDEVESELYFRFHVNFDDLPEPMCLDCAADHIKENSIDIADNSDYDADDPETYY